MQGLKKNTISRPHTIWYSITKNKNVCLKNIVKQRYTIIGVYQETCVNVSR